MKILYAYREYYDRWENAGVGKMLKNNYGHDVTFLKVRQKSAPDQIVLKHVKGGLDAVWLLYSQYVNVISKEAMEYIRAKKIPIIVYAPLITSIDFTENLDMWKKIDVFFAQNKEFAEWMSANGVNAHYVPIGFAPQEYTHRVGKPKYNVTFMGSCQTTVDPSKDKRMIFLKALEKFEVRIWGASFKKRGMNAKTYTTREEQINIYSKSKINLDLAWINSPLKFYKKRYHLKNRFFEAPATGNFLMTLRCPEFVGLLDETMIGYYDDDVESIKQEVDRYLKDDALRKQMAKRAYKEVHAKHTFKHRINDMLKILGW